MTERLLGIETEYGFTVLGHDGSPLSREYATASLMKTAREKLAYLPNDTGFRSIFLPSGRLYIDSGLHPEFSIAEVTNPSDAVRYVLAGEQILSNLASELEKSQGVSEVLFFKCNIDYSGAHTSWGCHESYLHKVHPDVLSEQIIPHLVSRIIYTGTGGFDPRSFGLRFMLSPRVAHLSQVISSDSTRSRRIYHTKDEPLCSRPYRRLHLICGESVCSHLAAWLKVATTALVVAMVEAGLRPGESVQLSAPLAAMHTFAQDTRCKAQVESTRRENLTALMIQRCYLDCAEAHMNDGFMPSWAEEVCRRWRNILDRLENAPDAVTTTLDWAIKLALYKDHVRRRSDTKWDCLTNWQGRPGHLQSTQQRTNSSNRVPRTDYLAEQSEALDMKRQQPINQRRETNFAREQHRILRHLRSELFEVDMRFGQLGQHGIFAKMDRAGVLNHSLPDVNDIEHAVKDPPASGRASIRGKCIKRLSGRAGKDFYCNWDRIIDCKNGRELDLSDPFANCERWIDMPRKTLNDSLNMDSVSRRVHTTPELIHILRQRTRTTREIRPGDRVRVLRGRCLEANQYIGQTTTVMAVAGPISNRRGPRLILDVDNAQGFWEPRHVRLVESASQGTATGGNNRDQT